MTEAPRKPQAFILGESDDTDEPIRKVKSTTGRTATLTLDEVKPDATLVTVPVSAAEPAAPRRWRLVTLLLSAVATLGVMWLGMTLTELIEAFFARSQILGWVAVAVAATASLAAIGIALREAWGLFRLRKIEVLQDNSSRAINLKDRSSAERAYGDLRDLYQGEPQAADALAKLAAQATDIMHPEDRLKLANRLLLEPRDAMARQIIAKRARRVTLLTTVTPAAALDILFVAAQNLAMLREIAALYGGRPSSLSTLRLARMVATHLAVTGGLALSDSLMQHIVGKGLLGRLSARFGEGAVNGILTTRIGLAACKLCRPIPKSEDEQEKLTDMIRELLTIRNGQSPQP